ncbi:OapA family protein [Erwinia sp. S43]|uniref:OapA family protein n=1 Tax=Erwinia sp. S43 TaxID=2769339 RepID=UPI001F2E1A83|nr:LysM-like peptidoglycan-binding domain-containing protein [Erwinia sp. S43]
MPNASKVSRSPAWLSHIWHLPDKMHWMDPLPAPHRRGIIVAVVVILLAFLWPTPSPLRAPVTPLQSGSEGTEVPLQANIADDFPQSSSTQGDSRGQWRNYTIASGQTLAQLFRDNNLSVNDVFAMAQVEGSDKPLSTLNAGQRVKIRLNAAGVVTGLTLESAGREILFTRQADGSFIRAQ